MTKDCKIVLYERYNANLLALCNFFISYSFYPRCTLQMKYITAKNFVGVSRFYRDYGFYRTFLTKTNLPNHFFNQGNHFCVSSTWSRKTPFKETKISFTLDVFYLDICIIFYKQLMTLKLHQIYKNSIGVTLYLHVDKTMKFYQIPINF